MTEFRFGGFSPFLRSMPRVRGHMGSLSTFVVHEPRRDARFVMNFHSSREISRGVRALIAVVRAAVKYMPADSSPQ